MDAFAPPIEARAAIDPELVPIVAGRFDLEDAVYQGVGATLRSLVPLVLAGILAVFAYVVSLITLVGWIFVVPLIAWGLFRITADATVGRAPVSAVWSGAGRFVSAVARMYLLGAALLVLGLPAFVPGAWLLHLSIEQPSGFFQSAEWTPFVVLAPGAVWGFVSVRWSFAGWLVVDRNFPPLKAIGASWTTTARHWGPLAGLHVLATAIALPAVGLQVGLGSPHYLPEILRSELSILGLGAVYVGLYAASTLLSWMISASAYRQIFGDTFRR